MAMRILKFVDRFEQISHTEDFLQSQKKISEILYACLSKGYIQNKNEVNLVQDMIETVKRYRSSQYFRIESIFIHGNKSQVEFDYYGGRTQKEFGDLILVTTLIDDNEMLFQKFTIVQAKKDQKSYVRWNLDKEQLFLLSNFPTFSGVCGIVPRKKFNLENISRCLGSFGLFHKPGEIIFLSAPLLEQILSERRSINKEIISRAFLKKSWNSWDYFYPCILFDGDLYDYVHSLIHRGILPPFPHRNVFRNTHFCPNLMNLIANWIRFNIGELVFIKDDVIPLDKNAKELFQQILRNLKRSAHKEEKELELFRYYENSLDINEEIRDGGSVGLIHLVINVGKEQRNRRYKEE